MNRPRLAFLASLLSLGFTARPASAAQVTLADCIVDAGFGGDNATRAFYFRDYPATNLGQVDVRLGGSGGYEFTLTVHDQTFDGPVVGVAVASASNPGALGTTFDFHGAPTIVGHTLAFSISYTTDGGSASIDVGAAPCVLEETEDNTPPLSTDRRDSIGARVRTYGPEITMVSPAIGSPAGGSGVTVSASYVGSTTALTFGGVAASSITLPDGGVGEGGTFTAITPPHAVGQVDVDLSVSYVNDAGVDASASATLHNGYFYGADAVLDSGGGGSGDGGASTTRPDGGDSGANGDTGSNDDSGCGCDLPGVASAPGSFAFALVGLSAILRRRRRR